MKKLLTMLLAALLALSCGAALAAGGDPAFDGHWTGVLMAGQGVEIPVTKDSINLYITGDEAELFIYDDYFKYDVTVADGVAKLRTGKQTDSCVINASGQLVLTLDGVDWDLIITMDRVGDAPAQQTPAAAPAAGSHTAADFEGRWNGVQMTGDRGAVSITEEEVWLEIRGGKVTLCITGKAREYDVEISGGVCTIVSGEKNSNSYTCIIDEQGRMQLTAKSADSEYGVTLVRADAKATAGAEAFQGRWNGVELIYMGRSLPTTGDAAWLEIDGSQMTMYVNGNTHRFGVTFADGVCTIADTSTYQYYCTIEEDGRLLLSITEDGDQIICMMEREEAAPAATAPAATAPAAAHTAADFEGRWEATQISGASGVVSLTGEDAWLEIQGSKATLVIGTSNGEYNLTFSDGKCVLTDVDSYYFYCIINEQGQLELSMNQGGEELRFTMVRKTGAAPASAPASDVHTEADFLGRWDAIEMRSMGQILRPEKGQIWVKISKGEIFLDIAGDEYTFDITYADGVGTFAKTDRHHYYCIINEKGQLEVSMTQDGMEIRMVLER